MSLKVTLIGTAIQTVIIGLLTVLLLESLVALSFRYPQWSPMPISLVRYLHMRFDRNVIQVMPECAEYDDHLTYRLRPGRCTFASREFSNEYAVNALGVRDDDRSLEGPEVVMLGDSLTMGWGVNQDETFPAVFERLTGRRTLNAGVSSYGTVRELRMLERVDRARLTDIVIQYMENDVGENRQFVEHPPFTTLSRDAYERTIRDQADLLRYVPGKYTLNLFIQLRGLMRQGASSTQPAAPTDAERQTEIFLRVLEQSPVDLAPYRLTVVTIDSAFAAALCEAAAASSAEWVRRIAVVDVSPRLSAAGSYYVLDDHPTAAGHAAIAAMLTEALRGVSAQAQ